MSKPNSRKSPTGENQHFVNRAHLRHFTSPGERSLLWEYDKLGGGVRQKSVNKICSRIHYYAQWDKDGNPDNTTIERKIGSLIEDPASPIIAGLRPNAAGRIELDGVGMGFVAAYVGTLMTRGPAFRDGVQDIHERILQLGVERLLASGNAPPMPPELKERVDERGLWNVIKAHIDPKVSIKPMFDMGAQIALSLAAKAWRYLLPADGMNFVTSDNPVSFRRSEEILRKLGPVPIGPAHPLSEVIVPLRKDLILVCHHVECESESELRAACGGVTKLSVDETNQVNLRSIMSAIRFVYSPERTADVQRQVQATKGTAQRLVVP